jgi:hypothetical protein
MRGHSAATAAGITAVPPEAGIFRFVPRCDEVTGIISLVSLSCPGLLRDRRRSRPDQVG